MLDVHRCSTAYISLWSYSRRPFEVHHASEYFRSAIGCTLGCDCNCNSPNMYIHYWLFFDMSGRLDISGTS